MISYLSADVKHNNHTYKKMTRCRKMWFFAVLKSDFENFDEKFQEACKQREETLIEDVVYVAYTPIKTFFCSNVERIDGFIQFQEEKDIDELSCWFQGFCGANYSEVGRNLDKCYRERIKHIAEQAHFSYGDLRKTGERLIRSCDELGLRVIHAMLCGESLVAIKNELRPTEHRLVDYPELRRSARFYQRMRNHIETKNTEQKETLTYLNIFGN